jgi:hypothetical protein
MLQIVNYSRQAKLRWQACFRLVYHRRIEHSLHVSTGLELLYPISWHELIRGWENDELGREWAEHYKARGYTSWTEWRSDRWSMLGCAERAWHLYEIAEPLKTVPAFRGGPFHSWLPFYEGKISLPFSQIVRKSDHPSQVKIRSVLDHFPSETTLIGLQRGEQILIFEGMHRCCALAVAGQEGIDVRSRVRIALADFSDVSDALLFKVAAKVMKDGGTA